ncbi:MAG TPA: hypothetical protein DCE78_02305 [Bacteroidetes bacterium]|nr:hypothetical protein [Bacteroidota bacterium]
MIKLEIVKNRGNDFVIDPIWFNFIAAIKKDLNHTFHDNDFEFWRRVRSELASYDATLHLHDIEFKSEEQLSMFILRWT